MNYFHNAKRWTGKGFVTIRTDSSSYYRIYISVDGEIEDAIDYADILSAHMGLENFRKSDADDIEDGMYCRGFYSYRAVHCRIAEEIDADGKIRYAEKITEGRIVQNENELAFEPFNKIIEEV